MNNLPLHENIREMTAEDEEKQQRLAQFHERNQQFLSQSQNKPPRENNNDILHLNKQILELQLTVRQLTNELETTREAYQLSSDKSRAEVALLQSQLEDENSRHEKITTSLRNRLVESELARIKMQEQLELSYDTRTKDEEKMKNSWMEMTSRVVEEKKWVDEQLDHWRESMEGRRSRLHDAKMRGAIEGATHDADNSTEKELVVESEGKRTVARRRSIQRQLWGKGDRNDSKDDDDEGDDDDADVSSDDDDSEAQRIFGK